MRYPCNLIKDILPLYHDGVASEESKKAVQEHFAECSDCRSYYDKMCQSDVIEASVFDEEIARQTAESFKEMSKKVSKKIAITLLKMAALITLVAAGVVLGLYLWVISYVTKTAEESWEEHRDVSEYGMLDNGRNIFERARDEQAIWPEKITDAMNVQEYLLIHYCPWDSNYLGYLEVEYNEADYETEVMRLMEYESTEYLGRYGAGEFTEYELIAMDVDSHHFTYALTDGEGCIRYVYLMFPGYSMDIEYEEYIPKACLPEGLDLSEDNPVRQKKLEESEADLERYKELQKKKKAK